MRLQIFHLKGQFHSHSRQSGIGLVIIVVVVVAHASSTTTTATPGCINVHTGMATGNGQPSIKVQA